MTHPIFKIMIIIKAICVALVEKCAPFHICFDNKNIVNFTKIVYNLLASTVCQFFCDYIGILPLAMNTDLIRGIHVCSVMLYVGSN